MRSEDIQVEELAGIYEKLRDDAIAGRIGRGDPLYRQVTAAMEESTRRSWFNHRGILYRWDPVLREMIRTAPRPKRARPPKSKSDPSCRIYRFPDRMVLRESGGSIAGSKRGGLA